MNEKNENDIVEEEQDTKEGIITAYSAIVENKRAQPVYNDFIPYEISRGKIRTHFGGIELLHDHMRENHLEFMMQFFSDVQSVFSTERSVSTGLSKYVITTAVADAKADTAFLDSLKHYCKMNDAQLVIMPCESITNSFENKRAIFDPVFNDPSIMVVTEDTRLNDNFSLCSIQVSAKQIKSITGLSRLGNREGSYVFASPKQFLEYIPSGNKRGKNYAIMTPGACTLPSYYSETFVSKRLSYIAQSDHKVGAIIVDIRNEQKFDFRQIQADEEGSFIDMGTEYNPDGSTSEVSVNVVLGDLHGDSVDVDALSYFVDLFSNFKSIDNLFIHDILDGHSISHHIKDIAEKALRSINNGDSLELELEKTFDIAYAIYEELKPKNMHIVKSNHDEFLSRYLEAGNYVFDPKNHYLSLKIAQALFEDKDVMKHAFECVGKEIPENWIFHDRSSSFTVAGVELAAHGDLGMNGARPSVNSLEKIYGECVTAHSHTPAIQRGVFRVGTLTKLDLGYNRGPSSWSHTCGLVYGNGQKQLINYVP
jgi:hypothetical protein